MFQRSNFNYLNTKFNQISNFLINPTVVPKEANKGVIEVIGPYGNEESLYVRLELLQALGIRQRRARRGRERVDRPAASERKGGGEGR